MSKAEVIRAQDKTMLARCLEIRGNIFTIEKGFQQNENKKWRVIRFPRENSTNFFQPESARIKSPPESLRKITVDKPVNLFVERVFQECFCLRF